MQGDKDQSPDKAWQVQSHRHWRESLAVLREAWPGAGDGSVVAYSVWERKEGLRD